MWLSSSTDVIVVSIPLIRVKPHARRNATTCIATVFHSTTEETHETEYEKIYCRRFHVRAALFSFSWSEQSGIALSIERLKPGSVVRSLPSALPASRAPAIQARCNRHRRKCTAAAVGPLRELPWGGAGYYGLALPTATPFAEPTPPT